MNIKLFLFFILAMVLHSPSMAFLQSLDLLIRGAQLVDAVVDELDVNLDSNSNPQESELTLEAKQELIKKSNISSSRKNTMAAYQALEKGNRYYFQFIKDYENAIKWYMEANRLSQGKQVANNQLKQIRQKIGYEKYEKYKKMFGGNESVKTATSTTDSDTYSQNQYTNNTRVVDRIIFKKGRGGTVFAKGDNRPFTGKFIKRYGDGQKEREVSYVDGGKHGIETFWYQNGEKWRVNSWKHNLKDGVQTVWEKEPIKRGPNKRKKVVQYIYSNGYLVSKKNPNDDKNYINELKVNYVNQIAAKIKNNWRYRGAKDGWGCDVHIFQDRSGNVKGHNLKSCYIDDNFKIGSFKNSIKRAVFKASPLPIAPNSSVFDEQIVFRFNVDDSNRKLAQGDIPNELKVNIDYDYLKTKVIDSGTCNHQNRPSRVTSCIANHYLVAKGDYKNALLWHLEGEKLAGNSNHLKEHQFDGKIITKLGRAKFEKITYQYNSGSIKLKDVRLWAFNNDNTVKNSSRKKASSDSFSDLWGQYGGSILDSDSSYTKQQSNFTSTSTADTKAPVISLDQNNFTTVESSNINLSGSIKDDANVSEVNINGGLIAVDSSGNFDITMYVGLGKNKFTIEALDIFGNKSSKTITVIRNKTVVKNKDKRLVPPTTQLASNPDSVALIIGLDDYKTMPNAPWAESDATTFYDYAHNVLGIPTERIRLITGQESNGIGIWKSLEQWLPSQVDKNKSNIYVYFAGHGLASEDGKEAYLMPYDGDTSMLSRTAILRKDVINGLDKLKARSVTLFMDTCYSGAAKGGKQTLVASRGLRIVKKNILANLPSNFTLFSAAANDETAISHPTQKNGLFSYWMMRGLGGEADSNNDNKLTNGELHAFISDKVQKTAISKGHNQHPQLVGDKDKVIASW